MWNEDQEKALLEVCEKYRTDAPENVLFAEPYLPYGLESWNGILVLAESQAIRPDDDYAQWLQQLTRTQRMTRLGRKKPPPYPDEPDKIGIGPWDDGTIKLALQAIFEGAKLKLRLEDIAVSNAVPWTRKSTGKNLNPDKQMEGKAAEFWKKIFDVWEPDIKALIVLGNIAKRVLTDAGILSDSKYKDKCLKLWLPSPNAINRVHGMFDCADLKIRFPEVERALNTIEINEKQYKMKVFFACHAVSRGKKDFQNWFR